MSSERDELVKLVKTSCERDEISYWQGWKYIYSHFVDINTGRDISDLARARGERVLDLMERMNLIPKALQYAREIFATPDDRAGQLEQIRKELGA